VPAGWLFSLIPDGISLMAAHFKEYQQITAGLSLRLAVRFYPRVRRLLAIRNRCA